MTPDNDEISTDPAQVLDVLRDVLLTHMDDPDSLPHYRVQSAVYFELGSGRLLRDGDIIDGCYPGGLILTMRNGSELRLLLS